LIPEISPKVCIFRGDFLELVQDSLTESKTAHFSPFFTFFQLRSTGYAPSKTQKLTKNQPVFANGRES